MSVSTGAEDQRRRGPVVAQVGGWLAGVSSALFAVAMVIGAMNPDREWGIVGGLFELRALVLVTLIAWVAGVLCIGVGWLMLPRRRPIALAAGVFWLILTVTALTGTLIGAMGGTVTWMLILGLVVMLVCYAVTAVALKELAGSEPGGPGVWGFAVAAAFMLLTVLAAYMQMPLVFVVSIGFVWVGAAIGFIAGGIALTKPR